MRCRACDNILSNSEMGDREIELPEGAVIYVMEDLCKKCRTLAYFPDEEIGEVLGVLSADAVERDDDRDI